MIKIEDSDKRNTKTPMKVACATEQIDKLAVMLLLDITQELFQYGELKFQITPCINSFLSQFGHSC